MLQGKLSPLAAPLLPRTIWLLNNRHDRRGESDQNKIWTLTPITRCTQKEQEAVENAKEVVRERPLRRDEVKMGTRVAIRQNVDHASSPCPLGTIQTVDSMDSFLVALEPPASGRVWLGRADVWPLRPRGDTSSDGLLNDRLVVGDRRASVLLCLE